MSEQTNVWSVRIVEGVSSCAWNVCSKVYNSLCWVYDISIVGSERKRMRIFTRRRSAYDVTSWLKFIVTGGIKCRTTNNAIIVGFGWIKSPVPMNVADLVDPADECWYWNAPMLKEPWQDLTHYSIRRTRIKHTGHFCTVRGTKNVYVTFRNPCHELAQNLKNRHNCIQNGWQMGLTSKIRELAQLSNIPTLYPVQVE